MAAADAATKEGTWGRWFARTAAKLVSFTTGVAVSNATSSAIDNVLGGAIDWVGADADNSSVDPEADLTADEAREAADNNSSEQTEEYIH